MTDEELMLLLKNNPEIGLQVLDMTKKQAKRLYVSKMHKQSIFQIHSDNKYRNGKWATHVYIDSRRKAVEKQTEDELYDYLYSFYQDEENTPKTFQDVFKALMSSKRNRGVSETTIKENERYFNFINPKIRNKQICNVSEDELRKWLMNEYLPRKPKKEALKKVIQMMKAVYSFAIRKKLCIDNPAQDIMLEDYVKFCELRTKANEGKSFSSEEIEKLREYCLEHKDNPHSAIMLVAMETGMRAGELAALRKEDIIDGFIYVHRQQIRIPKSDYNEKIYFTEVPYTKNERANPKGGRPIPITERCYEAIRIAFDLEGESEYLFHSADGNPIQKDSYEQYLRKTCHKLGISTSNNHAFRVAFNARLIEAGVDGIDRCLVLGHSMQTNERHYSYSDKRRAESVKNKLINIEKAV